MAREFTVVLTPSVEGGYVAAVPALPGCFTQGDTREQVLERVREAIEVTLEDMAERGEEPASEPLVEHVQIASAR